MFPWLEKQHPLPFCTGNLNYKKLQTPFLACRWHQRLCLVGHRTGQLANSMVLDRGKAVSLLSVANSQDSIISHKHTLLQPTQAPSCGLWSVVCSQGASASEPLVSE